MELYNSVVGFFQSGGLFMYPIVVVLALGLAIAIERYVYLSLAKTTNQRLWNKLMPLLKEGKYRAGGGGYRQIQIGHQPHLHLRSQPRTHLAPA